MLFIQALYSALRRTFNFTGRSDRLEQWTFAFVTAALGVGIFVATEMGVIFSDEATLAIFGGAVWFAVAHISLFVRRLHDNNHTGLLMLIPASALSVWLIGWLGSNGYIEAQKYFFLLYGQWIELAGRILSSTCGAFLTWIFLSEGDEDENYYGDPP
jgi:uncharacterized membrane protein YhaH (DUF805 family)